MAVSILPPCVPCERRGGSRLRPSRVVMYCSVPPYVVHYIQPKEGRGRIFEYAISLDYTPPQKVSLRL